MHLTLYVCLTGLITDLKLSICLRPQVSRKQTVDANMNLRKLFIMGRYFHIYSFSSVKWIILKFLLLQGPSFFPTCNCTHPLLTLWHIFFRPSSVSPGTSSSIASASQETSSSSEPPAPPASLQRASKSSGLSDGNPGWISWSSVMSYEHDDELGS